MLQLVGRRGVLWLLLGLFQARRGLCIAQREGAEATGCFSKLFHKKLSSGEGAAHSRSHMACTPSSVLEFVRRNGWQSSEVFVTPSQSHLTSCKMYQGNCNLKGENLLGTCFCLPGYMGRYCNNVGQSSEREQKKLRKHPQAKSDYVDTSFSENISITNNDDRCFYSPDGGVWAVSFDRWHAAQIAEAAAWRESPVLSQVGDRVEEHMIDFDHYKHVGPDGSHLGVFLEIGAGPWTQSKYMINERKFTVDKYVLLEPNALNYARDTSTTLYRDGHVKGITVGGGNTVVINGGAEHLDLMAGAFDTVMLINVLEHTRNAIQILRNTFNALKPGGILIFNDRWWNYYKPNSDLTVDTLYHPIRLKKQVFDVFLSQGFEKVYEITDRESFAFNKEGRNFNGTYFIGRKKVC